MKQGRCLSFPFAHPTGTECAHMDACPFVHEHRGPVSLAACVWRFTDASGENGSWPGAERGPYAEDERGSGISNPE